MKGLTIKKEDDDKNATQLTRVNDRDGVDAAAQD
jgi:hypothetical protein